MANRLAAQLARPRGLIGRQVSREMARTNAEMINGAISLLDVQPGHGVAEIGFGTPGSITTLADLAAPGVVIGIDHSPLAVRSARRRLKAHIASGRIRVLQASAEELPLEDASVERVLAINTLTYWHDLDAGVRELHRVLKDAGRLVIGVRAPQDLERLGISGPGIKHLDEADLAGLGARHRLTVETTRRGSDRRGDYLLTAFRR